MVCFGLVTLPPFRFLLPPSSLTVSFLSCSFSVWLLFPILVWGSCFWVPFTAFGAVSACWPCCPSTVVLFPLLHLHLSQPLCIVTTFLYCFQCSGHRKYGGLLVLIFQWWWMAGHDDGLRYTTVVGAPVLAPLSTVVSSSPISAAMVRGVFTHVGWRDVCLLILLSFLVWLGWRDFGSMEHCKWPTTYTYMFVYLILTRYFYYFVVVVDCKFWQLDHSCFPCPLCSSLPSSFFVETTIFMPKLPITTLVAKIGSKNRISH
jgi:hypothetical protein